MHNQKRLGNGAALWRVCAVAAMVLALGACGGGGDGAPASSTAPGQQPGSPAPGTALIVLDASTSCNIAGFKDSMLQQINAARAQARSCDGGQTTMPAAGALTWNDILFSAAARHSRDMAQNNYFAHTSLDGRTPDQRVSAEGYNWQAVGENLAAGYTSVDSVIAGWLSSPGHCRNLMDSVFVDVGVSCVQQAGTTFGTYWTMELGTR